MMKLGGRCIVQKYRPSSNLRPSPPGYAPPKCGSGLRRWENQRKLSSLFDSFATLADNFINLF